MNTLRLGDLREGKRELMRQNFTPIPEIGGKFLCVLADEAAASVAADVQHTFHGGGMQQRTIDGKLVIDLVYGFTVVTSDVAKALGYEVEPNAVVGVDGKGAVQVVPV